MESHTPSSSTLIFDFQALYEIDHVVVVTTANIKVVIITVELLSDKNGLIVNCGLMSNTKTPNSFSCQNKKGYKIRIVGGADLYKQVKQVEIFQVGTSLAFITFASFVPSTIGPTVSTFSTIQGTALTAYNAVMSFVIMELQASYPIDHVTVHNIMDLNSKIINGASVDLFPDNGMEISCGKIQNANAINVISCGKKIGRKIIISGGALLYKQIKQVDIFQVGKPEVFITFNSFVLGDSPLAKTTKTLRGTAVTTHSPSSSSVVMDFQHSFQINNVIVYNMMDANSKNIIGAIVELLSDNDVVVHQCGKIPNANPDNVISCEQKTGRKIRISGSAAVCKQIKQVDVFQIGKPMAFMSFYTSVTSTIAPIGTTVTTINGAAVTAYSSSSSYVILDLEESYSIDHVIVYNKMDGNSKNIIDASVLLYAYNGVNTFCGKIQNANDKNVIPCGQIVGRKIVISGGALVYKQIKQVDVFQAGKTVAFITFSKFVTATNMATALTFNPVTRTGVASYTSTSSYVIMDLQASYQIDYVIVYNVMNANSKNIIGASVELLSEKDVVVKQCGKISNTDVQYLISCGKMTGRKIRIIGGTLVYKQIKQVEVFQVGKPVALITFFSFTSGSENTGKSTTIVIKSIKRIQIDAFKKLGEMHFYTLDLSGTFNIDHVEIYRRKDCKSRQFIGTTIELRSDKDEFISLCGTTNQSTEALSISCKNVAAARIRITAVEHKYLQVSQLIVFGAPKSK